MIAVLAALTQDEVDSIFEAADGNEAARRALRLGRLVGIRKGPVPCDADLVSPAGQYHRNWHSIGPSFATVYRPGIGIDEVDVLVLDGMLHDAPDSRPY